MGTRVKIGRVVGPSATINGSEDVTMTPTGIDINQSNGVTRLTADLDEVQERLYGDPTQLLGFDENGDPVPVDANYELYGFELDMDETYGPNMVRYIAQNVNFTPAHMNYTTGVFDYGDWADAWFIKNIMPCMLNYDGTVAYELDRNDYTKKLDGSASDVANDSFAGNAMVGIPTVWVKVDTRVARKPKFYFSNKQLDGDYKAYAHHDDYGYIMPYTYMAIYNGSVDTNGRLRSISGKAPTATQSGDTQITEARANNLSGFECWDIEKFVDRQLINLLLLLIGKSTDTQTVFGFGNGNGYSNPATGAGTNGVLPTGTLNDKAVFYGYSGETSGVDDNLGVKVFGMENWWGNLWHRTMGLALSNGTLYYKLTKGTEDGSTVSGFNPASVAGNAGAPTGWIQGGTIDGTSGGIADTYIGEYGIIPKTLGGDYDSKYYDICYVNNTDIRPVLFGHNSGGHAGSGAFATLLNSYFSAVLWYFGASPSCKPNVIRNHGYFGFELMMDMSDPTKMIRYIGDNQNYTPVHMDYTNGVFDYGDWGDAWFIKNLRPCMLNYNGTVAYDLDKNDYTKKANGTASDVANQSFAGNAMVGIPTVWIKVDIKIPRRPKFMFADHKIDDTWHAYAHHDDNGNIMPYTYMPIYNGYKDSSNRLRSISGVSPTGNLAGNTEITYARNNNPSGSTIWDTEKFVDRQLINLLLLLIGKSTNTQGVFGYGNYNGNSNKPSGSDSYGVLPTGTLNDKGMFFGYNADNLGVKVFGIEHYWGNIHRRHMGLMYDYGVYYYKLTKGTEDGSTVTGFDISTAPTGWVNTGFGFGNRTVGTLIGDMYVGEYGLLPIPINSGSPDYTTKYCDYIGATYGSKRVICYGGTNGSGSGTVGAYYTDVYRDNTYQYRTIGATISCKPNVT